MKVDQALSLDALHAGRWYLPSVEDAEDTDSGSGGGTGTGDNPDDSSDDTDDSDKGGDDKKFTQDEVNRLIGKEVAKASRGKLDPKELGFDSGKELKDFLDQMKDKEEKDKTDAEKAQEQAVKDAVAAAQGDVLTKANARIVKAEFLMAAKDAGVTKEAAGDAFVLAQTLDIWKDVGVDDDGAVSGFDEDFFKTLQEAKPFLFASDEEDSDRDIGAGRRGGGQKGDAETIAKFPALNQPWRGQQV